VRAGDNGTSVSGGETVSVSSNVGGISVLSILMGGLVLMISVDVGCGDAGLSITWGSMPINAAVIVPRQPIRATAIVMVSATFEFVDFESPIASPLFGWFVSQTTVLNPKIESYEIMHPTRA
jgi:hypothetical protein